MTYLYEHGIIHWDIKSSNILVSLKEGSEESKIDEYKYDLFSKSDFTIKIGDFGFARNL